MLNKDSINIGLIYEGMKPPKTVEEIMKEHGVSKEDVETALNDGMKIEMEHEEDPENPLDEKQARTIASHHLFERIDYYKLLDKVEKAKKPHK
jgi:hypothetical protein